MQKIGFVQIELTLHHPSFNCTQVNYDGEVVAELDKWAASSRLKVLSIRYCTASSFRFYIVKVAITTSLNIAEMLYDITMTS